MIPQDRRECDSPLAELAFDRFKGIGDEEYGPFNPDTDTRDLFEETRQELADALVYSWFIEEKHGEEGLSALIDLRKHLVAADNAVSRVELLSLRKR